MRIIQCIIISIFAVLSASGTAPWGGYLGKYLFQRPFIGGLVCGMVFGDLRQGILIGAAMQLVYIGYFNVGGVQSIDMGIISFPCVAVTMMSGIDTGAAIALATGLGTLFTTLEMLNRTVFLPYRYVYAFSGRNQFSADVFRGRRYYFCSQCAP